MLFCEDGGLLSIEILSLYGDDMISPSESSSFAIDVDLKSFLFESS